MPLCPVAPLQALSGEMGPFLCSGSHQAQRDCQPSALNCFVEAMSQCVPPIPIRPCVLKYLGKTHNLWLRSTLMLEQQAFEKGLSLHIKPKQSTEFYEQESITPPQQVDSGLMLPSCFLMMSGRLEICPASVKAKQRSCRYRSKSIFMSAALHLMPFKEKLYVIRTMHELKFYSPYEGTLETFLIVSFKKSNLFKKHNNVKLLLDFANADDVATKRNNAAYQVNV